MQLKIDGKQIRTNDFVQKIMSNICWNITESLDDIPENPKTIEISLAREAGLSLSVDGQVIRMNPFVQKITHNIIRGMIDSLDEIPENPRNIVVSVAKSQR